MSSYLAYAFAAVAEIGGCFAFWAWLRLNRTALWILPGLASLALFAWLLTLTSSNEAGRAFAAYGGVYIVAAMGWMWLVEHHAPDRWVIGGLVCLAGSATILLGPRAA